MSEIFNALAKAQKNFEAARKASVNGGFKSKYADLSSCMDAVREPLNDQGVFVTQTLETVEHGIVVETLFAHESGETYMGGKLYIPVMKQDAQGYGSAITYGRRYSLLTACGVAPEDDDGNAATAAKPPAISKAPVIPSRPTIDLPLEIVAHLRDLSMDCIGFVKEGKPRLAYEKMEAEKLDDDQKTALWGMLDSGTRSAIKLSKTLPN